MEHARHTVRFAQALTTARAEGAATFLELGPDGVLSAMGPETLTGGGEGDVRFVPALRAGRPEPDSLHTALAGLWVRGVPVAWKDVFAGSGARHIDLPTYPFQRERFWPEPAPARGDAASMGQTAVGHALLGAVVSVPSTGEVVLTGALSLETHPWLADHVIDGTVVVPGTAFVELAVRAGDEVGCGRVEELTLRVPLVLPGSGRVMVRVVAGAPEQTGARAVRVYCGQDEEWTLHASGLLAPDRSDGPPAAAGWATAWPPAGAEPVDLPGLYDRLAQDGYHYGPVFQGLRAAWRRGNEVFAEAALPEDISTDGFTLHPALLDAAVQTLLITGEDRQLVSFAWREVSAYVAGAKTVRVRAVLGGNGACLHLADTTGTPIATIDSVVLRPLPAGHLTGRPAGTDALFRAQWQALPAPPQAPAGQRWVRLGTDPLDPLGLEVPSYACLDDLPGDLTDTMVIAPVTGGGISPEPGEPAQAVHEALAGVLGLVQEWLADTDGRFAAARLVVVTRRAVAAGPGERADVVAGPVWGLVRSAQAEHPGRITLADIDDHPASLQALPAALATGEDELALRQGTVLIRRLVRATPGTAELTPPEAGAHWRLEAVGRGTLDSLQIVEAPRATAPLQHGEVRVAVRAAGVNFRDVVSLLGIAATGETLGAEAAGVVVEAGPGTGTLMAGDRVLGVFTGSFAPLAVTHHDLVVPMPAGWSFAQAAAVPIAFCTAHYGLYDLAGLQAGQRVLIHAATGAVGQAAVQLARQAGAEVFATASLAKWPVLRSMGLDDDHIASSRDTRFERKFLAVTAGEGMDVVVNSLAGEYVDASLRLLPRGGCFLEMGKTDIRDPHTTATAHPGVTYRAFDVLEAGAQRIQQILTQTVEDIGKGVLRPIPHAAWDVRRAREAFGFMAQARHTGKIVLTIPRPMDPDGTVLITGGTGTLGAITARHLITRHGIRHLLLTSRHGPDAEGAPELAADLTTLGAQVTVTACDAADRDALAAVLDEIPAAHPLTAVVHAAGVIDAGVITSLTPERLRTRLRPKADAALNLHHLTQHHDLAAFVLFSSIAGVFGLPGQASYAAANTFLDALAEHRHHLGLPALSLAWGLWQQPSRMTAHLTDTDIQRLARDTGIRPLPTEEALALFDHGITTPWPTLVPIRLDLRPLQDTQVPAILRGLPPSPRRTARAQAHSRHSRPLAEQLAATPEAGRQGLVLDLVRENAATVLGFNNTHAITPSQNFRDIGLTSLAAVELRSRLQTATGLRLPATLTFDHPTPTLLSHHLLHELLPGTTTEIRTESPVRAAPPAIAPAPLHAAGMPHTPPAPAGPDVPPIRRATHADLEEITDILTEAFADNPASLWIYGTPENYHRLAPAYFRWTTQRILDAGDVYLAPGQGAHLGQPSSTLQTTPEQEQHARQQLRDIGAERAEHLLAYEDTLRRHHPMHTPHRYYAFHAVRPAYQSHGTGIYLAQHILQEYRHQPAYAETVTPDNLALYQGLGATRIGTFTVGEDITVTQLWWPPKSPPPAHPLA